MDMKIDAKRIRAEREKRAWSQDHLASVTGLGLRTIQRIESSGQASYESVSAIASVFKMDVSDFNLEREETSLITSPQPPASAPLISVPLAPRPAVTWYRLLYPYIALSVGMLIATAAAKRLTSHWWVAALIMATSIIVAGALSGSDPEKRRTALTSAVVLAVACFIAAALAAQHGPKSVALMISSLGGVGVCLLAAFAGPTKKAQCYSSHSGPSANA